MAANAVVHDNAPRVPQPPELGRLMPIFNASREVVALTVIDAEDEWRFSDFRWHWKKSGRERQGYVYRHEMIDGKRCWIPLHRDLLGLRPGDKREGDHINRDSLDNRKANLRVVTRSEQLQNVSVRKGTSKYRGVAYFARYGKWKAQVRLDKKLHFLGYHDTEKQAAKVAADFRAKHMPFSEEAN